MVQGDWRHAIAEVLVSAEAIQTRVSELGRAISGDYRHVTVGDELVCIGILKGAVIFLADLARNISVPTSFDFMAISSYGASTEHSGVVRILKDLDLDISGRDVLVVEDIVDTGLTLQYLLQQLAAREPRSLKVATLLDKPERRQVNVNIDYRGFTIPDQFVVGYGMDWNERGRNLPFVAVLKPEAYR